MRGGRGRPRATSLLGFFIITGLAVLAGMCLVAVDAGDFTDGLWRFDGFDGLPLHSVTGDRWWSERLLRLRRAPIRVSIRVTGRNCVVWD